MKNIFNQIKMFIFNKKINLSLFSFTIIYSLFITLFYNFKFFKSVYLINNSILMTFVTIVIVFFLYNLVLSLIFWKKTTKFFAILFVLINAGALYFMNTYNIAIDRVMLLNVKETDVNETLELLNLVFLSYIFFLGILPAILISKTQINYQNIKVELKNKLLLILSTIVVVSIILTTSYKTASSNIRQNKKLKHTLLPFNYIDASVGVIKKSIKSKTKPFNNLTEDVILMHNQQNNKKNLVIFVVGEASRTKNWSLYDYNKDTNKYLKDGVGKENLIYFDNFFSCGTSTAISVPCIFSHLERKKFDIDNRDNYSNLLDFLKKVDFDILWRENNSSCKGVCKRVAEENFTTNKNNQKFCNSKECFDEVLLDNLQEKINNLTSQNNFIVLHQKGSHGPAYYLRYPQEFEVFKPVCKSEYFNKCTNEEIVNAYDNTINYTSYFLNDAIKILSNNKENFNVALIYVSDHGQSLGENGIYLHGMPYKFSPKEQRHIPFFMWFSDDFKQEFNVNEQCLKNKQNQELSHDNIFHSVLGLFDIKTKYYDRKLDIFSECKY